jgi:uncharacterized protein with HEPN domain
MKQKSPKWLEDIRASAVFISQASSAKTLQEYQSDPLLRAAVERHFEIIGEAMNRLVRYDPEVASASGIIRGSSPSGICLFMGMT